MDLVASIRKEGTRGGRGEFKWSDVQSSQHRENYLGHSVMAPVGRWQKGRDLQWYSRHSNENEGSIDIDSTERARLDEIDKIRQAENAALSEVLGFDVSASKNGTSTQPVGVTGTLGDEMNGVAAKADLEARRSKRKHRDRDDYNSRTIESGRGHQKRSLYLEERRHDRIRREHKSRRHDHDNRHRRSRSPRREAGRELRHRRKPEDLAKRLEHC